MSPLVHISPDGLLHVGRASITLKPRQFDRFKPGGWLIREPEGSMWEPLGWVINMAVYGEKPELIPGILEGKSAGRGVFLDPIEFAARRPKLAKRWTEATGLEPGPHPMVLGTVFIVDELLVPLLCLQAIYDALGTHRAQCCPADSGGHSA